MSIVMSLLRIVLGVLIGIGIFVGLAVLGRYFPGITGFVFLWLFGGLMLWKIFYSLKTGRMAINARTKFVVYGRNSFEFWFYVLFIGLLAVLSFGAGVYVLLHPAK
jgi:hypothetical protein